MRNIGNPKRMEDIKTESWLERSSVDEMIALVFGVVLFAVGASMAWQGIAEKNAAYGRMVLNQGPYRQFKPQQGIASWYGKAFEGKPTASGVEFDPALWTAAHKKLPLGSRVRVTNLENGRSVIVRVNDRGPYVDDRIIDLSRKAARFLGMKDKGLGEVRLDILAYPRKYAEEG